MLSKTNPKASGLDLSLGGTLFGSRTFLSLFAKQAKEETTVVTSVGFAV